MASQSTKRRHEKAWALIRKWRNVPEGVEVIVKRANGETLETSTESSAFMLAGKYAMIRVRGIPGNTRLDRVTPRRGK